MLLNGWQMANRVECVGRLRGLRGRIPVEVWVVVAQRLLLLCSKLGIESVHGGSSRGHDSLSRRRSVTGADSPTGSTRLMVMVVVMVVVMESVRHNFKVALFPARCKWKIKCFDTCRLPQTQLYKSYSCMNRSFKRHSQRTVP